MPATSGMKDGGYYDLHSGSQAASIRILHDHITDAVRTLPLPPTEPVTILDLGSSEGGNALGVMNLIAHGLRQRTQQPIQTVYSDLPTNNFNRLFANLEAARVAGGGQANVYASAVAGSFYEQVMPPRSVHLATSFNSVPWLDRLPAESVPNFVVYRRPDPPKPGLVVPPATEEAFRRQAASDWERFLTSRATELAPGGKLIVATPGDSPGRRCSTGLYDVLNDACVDLVNAGQLQRAAYERLVVPVYFRTLEELVAPVQRMDSPFALDRGDTLDVPTPFEEKFKENGDAEAYAAAFAGFLRAFSEPVVRGFLVAPGEDSSVLDRLYGRVHDRLRTEPERYRFQYVATVVVLSRK